MPERYVGADKIYHTKTAAAFSFNRELIRDSFRDGNYGVAFASCLSLPLLFLDCFGKVDVADPMIYGNQVDENLRTDRSKYIHGGTRKF